ncbi:MAG TPA: methyltransferase [Terriglobia bacterium]|nr:methyltransferase [Terriglobia bacterium]
MEPFGYHVFVCDQQKPEGVPCCASRGSAKTIDALRKAVAAQGLMDDVQVTTCGSLGLCERGPNMVVYPGGVWYSAVAPDDVAEIVESHFRQGRVVERLVNRDAAALQAEIKSNRDKMLAALRAKEKAGIPPDDVMQRMRAFQESRVILTAVELDVFTAVGPGARSDEVAKKIATDPRATEMLMNALVATGMLTKEGGLFRNTPIAARFFAEGSPNDTRAATMHTVHLWRRWSTLTDCVRAGTSVTYSESADRPDDWTRAFIAAMHRNALDRAPLILQAVGTEGLKRMLDVGGGSGAYSIAFAKAVEGLQAELLDLETVIPIAQSHIEKAGVGNRVKTRAGDLRTDQLGQAFNLVLVSAICHMLGGNENRELLKRCYQALAPQGRVVIQDFILDGDKTSPKTGALFALNMLVGTKNGNSYSEDEYAAWLRGAGFEDIQHLRLPGPTGLMVATRK